MYVQKSGHPGTLLELKAKRRQREYLHIGGVHDPRENHKLGGSLFGDSSPHMDFQWMLMSILQLSGRLESSSFRGTPVGLLTHQ